jgi:hypothetical protein
VNQTFLQVHPASVSLQDFHKASQGPTLQKQPVKRPLQIQLGIVG